MIALLLAAATPVKTRFNVLGEGITACGTWIDRRREEPNRVLPEAAWVLGYVTAMARVEARNSGRNISEGAGGSAADHWIDNYCAAHPLDSIQAAASALVTDLEVRSISK